jgi:hypothetical protein
VVRLEQLHHPRPVLVGEVDALGLAGVCGERPDLQHAGGAEVLAKLHGGAIEVVGPEPVDLLILLSYRGR